MPIPAALRDCLVEWKLSSGRSAGLVFGRTTDAPLDARALARRAETAWTDAGLKRVSLHEARHTCASFFIAAGVNAKALSTFLGHASIQITFDRYGHLMPGSEGEAVERIDAFLERANTQARLAQLG